MLFRSKVLDTMLEIVGYGQATAKKLAKVFGPSLPVGQDEGKLILYMLGPPYSISSTSSITSKLLASTFNVEEFFIEIR